MMSGSFYQYSIHKILLIGNIFLALIKLWHEGWGNLCTCLALHMLCCDLENHDLYPAKPPTPPQWKALVWPLQTDTWLGLGIAFVSATLFLSALSRASGNGNPHFEWADCKSTRFQMV